MTEKGIYELVERATGKVKRSGDYWKIVNLCVKNTTLYCTRLKQQLNQKQDE